MTLPLKTIALTKTYPGGLGGRGIKALKGVTLEIAPGEIFGLLGPNGAGKTTLVKTILNILHASGGECELFGLPPSDPQSRLKVGYLQENHRFPRRMTGREILTLAGRLTGMKANQIKERADLLLEKVGMLEWADSRFSKYSKGMAQRVGIAQALIHDPDFVILDEPTDGVDPVGRAEIGKIIRDLKAAGKTTLINSHALAEVEKICDRVAILNQGDVLAVGAVSDLTAIRLEYVLRGAFSDKCSTPPAGIGTIMRYAPDEIVVHLSAEEQMDQLTDWLRGHGASIRSLSQRTRSLEQVFLELLENSRSGAVTTEAGQVAIAETSMTDKTMDKSPDESPGKAEEK